MDENLIDPPRTQREDTPPRTQRENTPPPTQRENTPPWTQREGSAPETTTEQGYTSVVLPPVLANRFRIVQQIGGGGEATVVLVREVERDLLRVVRLVYRKDQVPLASDAQVEQLSQQQPDSVVAVLERGQAGDILWELMPYYAHGSLYDLAQHRRIKPGEVRLIVAQLATALAAAHDLKLVHRDLKPGNILVSALDPVRVVLADFGLAVTLALSVEVKSSSKTLAYAPPECRFGEVSPSWDWWSLGMIVLELLDRHPFKFDNGTWFGEGQIVKNLERPTGPRFDWLDDATLPDDWRQLVRGLLVYEREHRWGAAEVVRWLAGEVVPVWEPQGRDQGGQNHSSTPPMREYVFGGRGYRDPVALAAALRADPTGLRRLAAGLGRAPKSQELTAWIQDLGGDTRAILDPSDPEVREAVLLALLDPDTPPTFQGRLVTGRGLIDLLDEARRTGWDGPATATVKKLAKTSALAALARVGHRDLGEIDDAWQDSLADLEQMLRGVPDDHRRAVFDVVDGAGRGQLLGLVLSRRTLSVRDVGVDPDAAGQPWFQGLMSGRDSPARAVLLEAASPFAGEATRQQRAEQERLHQQQLAQQAAHATMLQQQQAQAASFRMDGTLAVVCAISLFLGPLALGAGIWSIWNSRRGGLRVHTRAWVAAVWGGLNVGLTFIGIIASLGQGATG